MCSTVGPFSLFYPPSAKVQECQCHIELPAKKGPFQSQIVLAVQGFAE